MLPEGLHCIGIWNGQPVYGFHTESLTPPVSAPQPTTSNSKKRKHESTQEDDAAEYIKKPPNAFMIYMKEQRPTVEAGLNTRGTAAVNTVLGQRVPATTGAALDSQRVPWAAGQECWRCGQPGHFCRECLLM
ncbi:lymphoid enhancer-binding factor 1 [Larimichthys crocea]|uniref:lymphoid enhancer-binding factor 1 n=1 Tax=Larimichthys crocea TaxID=215358 RepID=UPI000F5F45D1|nr:lymphoid enhancer-binding factor 1 [Larimichthys crocea]